MIGHMLLSVLQHHGMTSNDIGRPARAAYYCAQVMDGMASLVTNHNDLRSPPTILVRTRLKDSLGGGGGSVSSATINDIVDEDCNDELI